MLRSKRQDLPHCPPHFEHGINYFERMLLSLLFTVANFLSVSHSQTTTTRHPSIRSPCCTFRSLTTFSSNFLRQKLLWVIGIYVILQPRWRCQKQPCTNTATRYFDNTISGRPSRSRWCKRNRYPIRCSSDRTASSGFVFLPRIPDIISLRFARDTISVITLGPPAPARPTL